MYSFFQRLVSPKKVWLFGSIFILLLDQLFKFLAYQKGWSSLNQGFSLAFGSYLPSYLVIALSGGVIGWLWFQRRHITQYPHLVTVLCLAGVSNLIDRGVYGGVVDYIPVPGINIHNNLADWLIFVSICLLTGEFIFHQIVKAKTR